MYFQKDIETMPRADIEKMQLERLQRLVKYCYDNVPFYHKRLSEAGVCPEKIMIHSVIQYIPYTTKADLRDNYPCGLFAVPQSKIVRMHASSGTTGKPTEDDNTAHDHNYWSDCVARLPMAAVADE